MLVVNYSVPTHQTDYIHRCRTCRSGKTGTAITFISPDEGQYAPMLVKALSQSKHQTVANDLQQLADDYLAGKNQNKRAKTEDFDPIQLQMQQQMLKAKATATTVAKLLGATTQNYTAQNLEEKTKQCRSHRISHTCSPTQLCNPSLCGVPLPIPMQPLQLSPPEQTRWRLLNLSESAS